MDVIHEKNRVYVNDEKGEMVAEVTFPNAGGNTVTIDRTYVAPALRGGGVASELLEHAYQEIKGQGKKTHATCPYAVSWFKKHEGKRDILLE